jgi:hypothetical protein
MINARTKQKIEEVLQDYRTASKGQKSALKDIAIAEIPEMVYNSNAIENSTLSLEDTEDIILRDQILKDHDVREIFEAKKPSQDNRAIARKPRPRTHY